MVLKTPFSSGGKTSASLIAEDAIWRSQHGKADLSFLSATCPFTYEGLNRDFYETVDAFINTDKVHKIRYVSEKTWDQISVV